MKLFLSSLSIDQHQQEYFVKLVGKELSSISFALIENAADIYTEEKRRFVYETRKNLQALGMQIDLIDLRDYQESPTKLYDKLKLYDVIWVGGGNTFYLRWIMKVSGLDTILSRLLKEGRVYGGGSAGAIVVGPRLEHFDLVDDPSKSPEQIYAGLGITDRIVIPHWGIEKYQDKFDQIKKAYEKSGHQIITITDNQAVAVSNDSWEIVP